MEIKIRKVSKEYLDVSVEYWGTKIDIGLQNESDAKKLAAIFENAADELQSGWPETVK